MAKVKFGTSGGGGLTTFIAGLIAFFNTPSFVGWSGAGKATLVGMGTSFGGGLCAFGGAVVGGGAGYLVGKFMSAVSGGKTSPTKALAIGGAVIGGIGGFGFGVYQGYTFSKDALTQNCADVCQQAPAAQKTASLDVPRHNVMMKV